MEIKMLKVGQIVEGTVIKIEENTIYLDVRDMTEGKIHLDNYSKPAPETFIGLVNIGDKVRARVQKRTDDPAQILLSRLPLLAEENFERIKGFVTTGAPVKARVKQVLDKGLLLTYLENEVFLPYSLLDYDLVKNKETLKNKILEIEIIEATQKGSHRRIVGSRKAIFERERQEAYESRVALRQEELDSIQTGAVIKGTVDKIEPHAATIRFNHVVGLLRISQVSHHRIDTIDDILVLGEEVEVKVIKKEGNRLDLSMKALQKTPYEIFYAEHKIGDNVTGTVFQKLPFGIIVEVARDVRGLLHRNEYSWNPNDNFDNYVKIGDEVTLSIIQLDVKKERIALSRKALEDNPWKNVTVKRGEVVKAKVKEVTKDGLTVEVQGVDGFIPLNELSNEKIGRPEEYFAIDDEVDAVVTEVNKDQWVLKLSIKRVLEQAERASFEEYLEDDDQDSTKLGDLFDEDLAEK
ncbi:MAG: S1 RNA-binding domain-containing protein [Acholeplasmataceae bacterium]